MKTDNKILLAEFADFVYHYFELDFWTAFEEFKKRKNPQLTLQSEVPLPVHEEVE